MTNTKTIEIAWLEGDSDPEPCKGEIDQIIDESKAVKKEEQAYRERMRLKQLPTKKKPPKTGYKRKRR